MAAKASWAREQSAINNNASFEIKYVALDSDDFSGSGFPGLSVKAPLYGAYLEWCGSWHRPTPRC